MFDELTVPDLAGLVESETTVRIDRPDGVRIHVPIAAVEALVAATRERRGLLGPLLLAS